MRLREVVLLASQFAAGQSVRPAFLVEAQIARIGVAFEQMLPRIDQKPARPGRRIANPLARFRIEHLDQHPNDVPRRPKLPVGPGRVELAQQVLVQIALHVLILRGDFHAVDRLAGFDQQTGLVDLELGVRHLLAERTGLGTEVLQERKDFFFHLSQRLLRRELTPMRPAQFLVGEQRLRFLASLPRRPFGVLLAFVQLLEKQQKRQLLNGIQRIGQPAGPKLVPQRVDFGTELRISEHNFGVRRFIAAFILRRSRCSLDG